MDTAVAWACYWRPTATMLPLLLPAGVPLMTVAAMRALGVGRW
jgi:hypothetical protein